MVNNQTALEKSKIREEIKGYDKELSIVCDKLRDAEERLHTIVTREVLNILPTINWELRIRRMQDLSFLWIEFKATQKDYYHPSEIFDLLGDCDSVEYDEYKAKVVVVDNDIYLRFENVPSAVRFITDYQLKVNLSGIDKRTELLDDYLNSLKSLCGLISLTQ